MGSGIAPISCHMAGGYGLDARPRGPPQKQVPPWAELGLRGGRGQHVASTGHRGCHMPHCSWLAHAKMKGDEIVIHPSGQHLVPKEHYNVWPEYPWGPTAKKEVLGTAQFPSQGRHARGIIVSSGPYSHTQGAGYVVAAVAFLAQCCRNSSRSVVCSSAWLMAYARPTTSGSV